MPDVTPEATPGQAARTPMSPEFAAELIAANEGLGQLVASLRRQLDAAAAAMFPRMRSDIAKLEERLRQAEAELAADCGCGLGATACARQSATDRDLAVSEAAALRGELARAGAGRDAAREALGVACDSLENTAAGMDLSAMTTHPSKKSEIERGCAHAIRAITRTAREALAGDAP